MSDFIHTSVIQMAWNMNTEHVTLNGKRLTIILCSVKGDPTFKFVTTPLLLSRTVGNMVTARICNLI